jgi:hypothetical protein
VAGCRFHPEVHSEAGRVSIWLPELGLYGHGASLSEAREDLLGEVRHYLEEYLNEAQLYSRGPDRSVDLRFVIRARLADGSGQLPDVLFAPPA